MQGVWAGLRVHVRCRVPGLCRREGFRVFVCDVGFGDYVRFM